jgi:hypothetical protein
MDWALAEGRKERRRRRRRESEGQGSQRRLGGIAFELLRFH